MTVSEKHYFQYSIVANDRSNIFNFEKDFYELDWYDITKLDHYAEVFGIKTTDITRARKLWYRCQQVYRQLPF